MSMSTRISTSSSRSGSGGGASVSGSGRSTGPVVGKWQHRHDSHSALSSSSTNDPTQPVASSSSHHHFSQASWIHDHGVRISAPRGIGAVSSASADLWTSFERTLKHLEDSEGKTDTSHESEKELEAEAGADGSEDDNLDDVADFEFDASNDQYDFLELDECSGHGTCEFLKELRPDLGDLFKFTGDSSTTDPFSHHATRLWDAGMTRACVCDGGWGGADCGMRLCGLGVQQGLDTLTGTEQQRVTIHRYLNLSNSSNSNNASSSQASRTFRSYDRSGYDFGSDFENFDEFALTFRSALGEEMTTRTLSSAYLTSSELAQALNALPNNVIKGLKASVNHTVSTELHVLDITIEFDDHNNPGDQYALECLSGVCGDGCQPKLAQGLAGGKPGSFCRVSELVKAESRAFECSARGRCNHDTGLCECYEGYSGEVCDTQAALM